jgi:TRAP-type C4-dicarboxylate transport system substrate-binding protein
LDEPTRAAVRAAAGRAEARGWEMARASETEMAARLSERGMAVPEPAPQLMAQLREIGAQQAREWLQRAGPEGEQMMQRYRAAVPR